MSRKQKEERSNMDFFFFVPLISDRRKLIEWGINCFLQPQGSQTLHYDYKQRSQFFPGTQKPNAIFHLKIWQHWFCAHVPCVSLGHIFLMLTYWWHFIVYYNVFMIFKCILNEILGLTHKLCSRHSFFSRVYCLWLCLYIDFPGDLCCGFDSWNFLSIF